MGSTKIINVLKNDTFQEVFRVFKDAPADEIIFVLPKRSKAFSDPEHFQLVSAEAEQANKTVSLLTEDAEIAARARQHGLSVLSTPPKKQKVKPVAKLAAHAVPPEDENIHEQEDAYEQDVVVPSDEQVALDNPDQEDEMEGMHVDEEEGTETPPEEPSDTDLQELEGAEQAGQEEEPLAELTAARTDRERTVKVSDQGRAPTRVGISRAKTRQQEIDQLEQVWRSESAGKSLWTDVFPRKRSLLSSITSFFQRHPRPAGAWNFSKQTPGRSRRIMWTLAVAGALLLGGVVYVWAGSAEIRVTPVEKQLDFKIPVQISDATDSVDVTFGKLPGQLFTVERTVSQTFNATGQKEVAQKARGVITAFNAYGTAPQTLIATTRFESPDGSVFRTLKTITVPGTKVENGVITPGQIDVEVIADKPGKAYNIGPARFVLPAFRERGDTARYEKYYGQSTAAMTGGISGMATVVTESDYIGAREATIKKLQDDVAQALQSQAAGLTVPSAALPTVKTIDADATIEQAVDSFSFTATGMLKTMGIRPDDVQTLLAQYVDKSYDLVARPGKTTAAFTNCSPSESRSVLSCTLAVSGTAYAKVDQQKIISDLLGKPEEEIRNYLRTAPGVGSATVILSPFWVRTMPSDKGRIRLEMAY